MAVSRVTLYMHPGTCALVPHILLAYTGVPYTTHPVTRETMAYDSTFSAMNPKKQVPVLKFNDTNITEVPAIVHAINHLAPENAKIMGFGTIEFLRVCEWMNFLSASLHAQVWASYARPWRWTDDPDAEAGIKKKSRGRVIERYEMIESLLRVDGGWTVGEGFTAADAYLLPFFRWGNGRMGLDMQGMFPKWAKLAERVEELDAVKGVLEAERRMEAELGGASDFSKVRT